MQVRTFQWVGRKAESSASEATVKFRWYGTVSALLVAVCFAILALAYRNDHPFLQRYFISDLLYLPTLFDDIFSGGSFARWYLPPAPYFFPDYPEFLVAYVLGEGTLARAALFSAVQLLLLLSVTFALARGLRMNPGAGFLAGAIVLAILSWLALRDTDFRGPSFVFISGIHFGTFLSAALLAAGWLGRERKNAVVFGFVGVLCFVAALSDSFFVVQAVVPFAVATAIVRAGSNRAGAFAAAAIAGVSGIAGFWSYRWVVANDTRPPSAFSVADLGTRVQVIAGELSAMFQDPLLVVVVLIYVLICGHVLVSRARGSSDEKLAWLVVYSAVSVVSTPLALAVIPALGATSRYFIPTVFWPIVVVIVVAVCRESARLIAAVVATVALVGTAVNVATAASVSADYPPDVACIDRAVSAAGARYGIAAYWDAKPIQNQSLQNVVIAQYTSDLQPRMWLTTSRYFREAYDFAIVDHDSEADNFTAATLLGIAPNPRAIVKCGTREVYLYGTGGLYLADRSLRPGK